MIIVMDYMIDWWGLAANSIWITAAGLALAVVSVAYYKSNIENQKVSSILKRAEYALLLNNAGAIFCLGMALTANRWWEIGLLN
jgi:hypothetical protein